MGWKNLKEHYGIVHHVVQVTEKGVSIGTLSIADSIVINLNGRIVRRYDGMNGNLQRYLSEMEADPETLRRLVQTPDTFSEAIPVYTYEDGEVIEKFCEKPGYPNVTHDGRMMYEQRYSTDRSEVVNWAKGYRKSALSILRRDVEATEQVLTRLKRELAKEEDALALLRVMCPDVAEVEGSC